MPRVRRRRKEHRHHAERELIEFLSSERSLLIWKHPYCVWLRGAEWQGNVRTLTSDAGTRHLGGAYARLAADGTLQLSQAGRPITVEELMNRTKQPEAGSFEH